MSADILTENLLAALLLLAEGETDITLDEALLRLEQWQRQADRHFGIDQLDMRCAFQQLQIWTSDYPRREGVFDYGETMRVTTLREWIPYMLQYHEVYCNDESEHWHEKKHRGGLFEDGQASSFRNYQMRKFFRNPDSHDPDKVMRFLGKLGIGPDILFRCSRLGESS